MIQFLKTIFRLRQPREFSYHEFKPEECYYCGSTNNGCCPVNGGVD